MNCPSNMLIASQTQGQRKDDTEWCEKVRARDRKLHARKRRRQKTEDLDKLLRKESGLDMSVSEQRTRIYARKCATRCRSVQTYTDTGSRECTLQACKATDAVLWEVGLKTKTKMHNAIDWTHAKLNLAACVLSVNACCQCLIIIIISLIIIIILAIWVLAQWLAPNTSGSLPNDCRLCRWKRVRVTVWRTCRFFFTCVCAKLTSYVCGDDCPNRLARQ